MSPHLNILCISSEKPYYTENINIDAFDVTVILFSTMRALELGNVKVVLKCNVMLAEVTSRSSSHNHMCVATRQSFADSAAGRIKRPLGV